MIIVWPNNAWHVQAALFTGMMTKATFTLKVGMIILYVLLVPSYMVTPVLEI